MRRQGLDYIGQGLNVAHGRAYTVDGMGEVGQQPLGTVLQAVKQAALGIGLVVEVVGTGDGRVDVEEQGPTMA